MDIAALREEFNTVKKQAHDLLTDRAKEKKSLSAEDREANDKRFARLDQIHEHIQEHLRFAKAALAENAPGVVLPADPAGRQAYERSEGQNAERGPVDLVQFRKAMNKFAQTGDTRQLFTMTSVTDSGVFLPKEVLAPVTVRRLQNVFRAIINSQGVEPIEIDTVASFSIPVADDTANAGQTGTEGATSGTVLDPSQTGIAIAPTLWDSKALWYSNTMVMAQTFDVVGYSLPMLQKRIQKAQESAWMTNVTTNATNTLQLAVATAITYAQIISWEHTLPAAYRNDAAFAFSDSLYKAIRSLVDSNNRPVMDLDPTNVFQGKLHNRPVFICDYLGTLAANHTVGMFASADALKIVDVKDARIARYSNLPSNPDQVGFQMFQNGDFGFITNGVALLTTGVS